MEKDKILNFFSKLEFDEGKHLYTVNGSNINSSVSKVIKNFVKPFDTHNVSLGVAKKRKVTQEQVITEWKSISNEACDKGTRVHLFGELYPFNKTLKPSDNYERAIVKFWNDLPEHIVPVIMELRMYHKDYLFAGTGDILLYNTQTGHYIIGDYKTNKDLFKNFQGQKMLSLFDDLLDMPLNHYQLQLSFYQILFEQIGLKVESRKIIWLKPDANYEMYDTEDYTGILKSYLKHNKV
jgi:hypothetical protein